MKTILLPIDFSHPSLHAAALGVKLASALDAKAVLFHAIMLPVIDAQGAAVVIPYEEFEQNALAELNGLKATLLNQGATCPIEVCVKLGFAVEEIQSISSNLGASLIVMSISGSSGLDRILGGTTSVVMEKSPIPVLVVPKDAPMQVPMHFLVTDDEKPLHNLDCFSFFQAMLTQLKAEAENITITDTTDTQEIVERLTNYIATKGAESIVFVKRKHNFISSLLHDSTTRLMAFNTHVPLLVLHDY